MALQIEYPTRKFRGIDLISKHGEYCERGLSIKQELESNYLFIDLEINSSNKIYRIGLYHQQISLDIYEDNFSVAYEQLKSFKQQGISICGHNFRRFDYSYLIEQQYDFHPWSVIDTLELSILAFPLQPSHKLNKEYKNYEHSSNNPLEDAKETKLLLKKIVNNFLQKPPELCKTYRWLLTCGNDFSDKAYQHFFTCLGQSIDEIPFVEKLPAQALIGFEQSYVEKFFQESSEKDFDSRLCMAGLLAWNYERNVTEAGNSYSGWLSHLPGFYTILNGVRPLLIAGLSYEQYLSSFNIKQFRDCQEEAVAAIINHQNPLVLMPTGGGKSLCYQLPAWILFQRQRALTVVISPLQALMADQVVDLENEELHFATFINANLTASERRNRLEKLLDGRLGLLYISPEQLRSLTIRSLLEERPPALWVIDEAHCISQWGHDFRPDYRYIPKFVKELAQKQHLPLPRMALMTATATFTVREDIKKLFSEYQLPIQKEVVAMRIFGRISIIKLFLLRKKKTS